MCMQIRLDPDVNALYIEVRAGEVAKTLEVSESVFVDVDEEGAPLGMEFVNADDFIPFLREHAGGVEVPAELRDLLEAPTAR